MKSLRASSKHYLIWALTLASLPVLGIWLSSFWSRSALPALGTDHQPVGLTGKTNPARAALPLVSPLPLAEADQVAKARVSQVYGQLPMSFEANRGQADAQVKFLSRGSGYSLFLTSTEAVLSLSQSTVSAAHTENLVAHQIKESKASSRKPTVLRMKLAGANSSPPVDGIDELRGKSNYLIGNDPQQWQTDVPHYAKVRYRDVYPGVDLVYYGNQRQLEYDLVVAPGTDPSVIKLAFAGARQMRMAGNGDLVLRTAGGDMQQRKPVIYQEVDGVRKEIAGHYVVKSQHEVGFKIAAYDASKPLVIDPVLSYSTYFGGSGAENALGVAVDSSGNAYLTGFTSSTDFPVKPIPDSRSGTNGFIAKLDTTQSGANSLVYSTYITGIVYGVAVDGVGNAYLAGERGKVTKLNAAGNGILYSFTITTSATCYGIAVDGASNAYVTGKIGFSNLPLKNEYQGYPGGNYSAFVTKLDTTKSGLASVVYSTYLGSGGEDLGYGIAVDNFGNAYLTGGSNNAGFPLKNQYQDFQGGTPTLPVPTDDTREAFVARVDTTKSGAASLIYSTYLGGSGNETGRGIAVDGVSNVYVTGVTASGNFPLRNQFQSFTGGKDVFVTKIDTNQSGVGSLVYSTLLGGTRNDTGLGIAVNPAGSAYVTGWTSSSDFPLAGTTQGLHEVTDGFLARLNVGGNRLVFSTYLGGFSGSTISYGIVLDSSNNVYVAGGTLANDYPLLNQYQNFRGGQDAFLTKFSPIFDVALTMSHTGNFAVGSNGSYTLTVANVGEQPATGTTQITDTLPPGFSFVSATGTGWTCSAVGQTVTCTYDSPLAVETSASLMLNVGVSAPAVPHVTNTATVATTGEVVNTANNTVNDPTDVFCPYSLSSSSQPFVSGGGSGSVLLTSPGGCSWTAISNASWILITSSSSGSGNSTVNYFVSSNSGPPRTSTLTIAGQLFTVSQAGLSFSLSGRVTLSSSGLSSVTMTLSGSRSGTTQTDSNGNYSFANLPAGGNYTVTPTKTNYNFTPNSYSVNNLSVNFTVANFAATVPVVSVSAASYSESGLASGSIATAFGIDLATMTQAANTTPLPVNLGGTVMSLRDSQGGLAALQLFFVSSGQINFYIPTGVALGPATLTIMSGDGVFSIGAVQINAVAPSLFTANANGQGVVAGVAARFRSDGSQSFEQIAQFDAQQNKFVSRPLDLGSDTDQVFLELFGTGFRSRSALSAVMVTIGGVSAEVQYAGAQGDFVGLDQLNVRVPRSLIGRGEVPVVLTVDGQMANTVLINIK